MSDVTIKQLATVLGTPVDKLLTQLAEAGMSFTDPEQSISSTEKVKLLGFLRRNHGKADASSEDSAPKQVTLKRRTVSELTVNPGQRGAATKTVNVEVRQKRTYVKRSVVEDQGKSLDPEREDALRKLEESQAKRDAEDQVRQDADRRRHEEEAKVRAAEEAKQKAEEAARAAAAEVELKAKDDSADEADSDPVVATAGAAVERPRRSEDRTGPVSEGAGRHGKPKHASGHRGRDGDSSPPSKKYFGNELHLSQEGSARRTGRKKPRARPAEPSRSSGTHGFSRPSAPVVREVEIGETISVADLAQRMAVKGAEVVKTLFKMGVMATINQVIDHDTAQLVVEELGHTAVKASPNDAEVDLLAHAETTGTAESRPPVVTIMGHVDHGKTSLLDTIRRTKVASGEAGGITQHIGAYHVETPKGVITFLDTPGHAAFTSMRQRGAQATDIVILVVAADDGVKPQTIEAIKHARSAKVPLIVAMNKMDKPEANPDNVKQGLAQHEVMSEDWGGDVQFVPVSAKAGTGIDDLLEAISLQAELMELTAVREGRASGAVIESSLDKGRGPVATVLVQQGTLKKGDFVVCGVEYGRVRALFDETGAQIDEAGPSIPVQLLGLSGVPEAGDDFVVVADERLAKDVASQRDAKRRETRLVAAAGNRMEDVLAQMGQGEGQLSLNLVIKADVQGSVEALRQSLTALSNDMIRINVISSGVGGITESDATRAASSKATIIGFNVRADAAARRVVESSGLDLRYFSIIYDVIDQVKQVATGLLGVEIREEIIGIAEVRDVFRSSKFGAVAGCMVIEGSVKRNKPIRVLRDSTVIFEGELESLRRFKELVDEVRNGTECGIAVKQYNDVKAGDQIECFERIEVQRTL
ncbi:MAG: translation initiation factor IF-2 [Dokdonella sp.]|uniref:translation initiation factor IF-2 n=1 Tax=Dokdonella sp. TaxID=2291710 RepID=UPI002CB33553|nr:translation initiation factor IF-2 [Dokdonella sp.]HOX70143.1 translation initiation factor IF-2 [Dokdonella sp.]HPG94042.1 translation initiation factor IF-2 [Dokdonella sp.]HPN80345.1 translation initiation factor IF-2 [Dokdonella sp.]